MLPFQAGTEIEMSAAGIMARPLRGTCFCKEQKKQKVLAFAADVNAAQRNLTIPNTRGKLYVEFQQKAFVARPYQRRPARASRIKQCRIGGSG